MIRDRDYRHHTHARALCNDIYIIYKEHTCSPRSNIYPNIYVPCCRSEKVVPCVYVIVTVLFSSGNQCLFAWNKCIVALETVHISSLIPPTDQCYPLVCQLYNNC